MGGSTLPHFPPTVGKEEDKEQKSHLRLCVAGDSNRQKKAGWEQLKDPPRPSNEGLSPSTIPSGPRDCSPQIQYLIES